MDLSAYFKPILKWRRLVVLSGLVAMVSTFLFSLTQPAVYQASATLIIGQSINNPNPSSNQFYLEQDLAGIYADMAGRDPIRSATMSALSMNSLPLYSVRALPNTQLLEIDVTDTNPQRAKAVATELANQLIQRSPTGVQPQTQSQQAFVNDQLTSLQNDILTTQDEIANLKLKLGSLRDARDIADVEQQITASDEKLRTLQSSYASLLSSSSRGAVNTLSIVEPPELPRRPVGSNRLLTVLLAALLGVAVGMAGAYLIEYMDKSVKERGDVTGILHWPVLAAIEQIKDGSDPATVLLKEPRSVIANSFRLLKTNLELAGVGSLVRSVLVTGPSIGEGKSTIARSLALAFAKSGNKVVLVDADSQRPGLALDSRKGLSDLLVEGGDTTEALETPYPEDVPGLAILGPGTSPLGSAWFLDTPAFDRLLATLKQEAIVIIDGPPSFMSDSLVLAAKADGVLGVLRLGHSKKDNVRGMKAQLQSGVIHVLGVVINGAVEDAFSYEGYADAEDDRSLQAKESVLDGQPDSLAGRLTRLFGGNRRSLVARLERWLSGKPALREPRNG